MRTPTLLMRLLVVLCLLGNGFGTAYANAQMSFKHAQTHGAPAAHDAAAAPTVAAAEHHCHEAMDVESGTRKTDVPPPSDRSDLHSADCCGGPTCQCACAYHASFVSTAMSSVPGVPPDSVLFATLDADHASPTLPHLIRPPIR